MELEELKKQWNELSQELNKQKIINRKMIERTCESKINYITFNSAFGIFLVLMADTILFFVNDLVWEILPKWFMILTFAILNISGVWQVVNLSLISKIRNYKNDILTSERAFLRFRKSEHINLLFQSISGIFFATSFVLIYRDLQSYYPLKPIEAVVSMMILATVISIITCVWYNRKLKDLKAGFETLKEFEK